MEQALAAVRRLPAVDGLVEQLLVRDDVAQPVGAEQQEIPRLELLLVQICPDALLRAQCPGDQVLPGMSTGLLGGDVPRATMSSTTEWSRVRRVIPSSLM